MDMKKIIALALSTMMLSTSLLANAAVTQDTDGWYVNDDPYTVEEVKALQPNVDFVVTQLKTDDEVKALSSSFGKTSPKASVASQDIYKVDVTVSALGDLFNGYNDNYDTYATRLFEAKITLPGDAFFKQAALSKFNNVSWSAGYQAGIGTNLVWNAGTGYEDYYPYGGEAGAYVANASMDTASFLIAVTKGAEIEIAPKLTVTYYYQNGDGSTSDQPQAIVDLATLKLAPEADKAKAIDFTAAKTLKTETGYIWALTFTEYANLATMSAKFETATESVERAFNNVDAIVTALGGATAPYTLNVGLITNKTLTKATFTGDDADNADTPACVKSVEYENN